MSLNRSVDFMRAMIDVLGLPSHMTKLVIEADVRKPLKVYVVALAGADPAELTAAVGAGLAGYVADVRVSDRAEVEVVPLTPTPPSMDGPAPAVTLTLSDAGPVMAADAEWFRGPPYHFPPAVAAEAAADVARAVSAFEARHAADADAPTVVE